MRQERARIRVVPRSLAPIRIFENGEAAKLKRQLGFPVRTMPRGQVPMFSQPVGEWWVDVYREGEKPRNLPARADKRWMRACGLGLVAATLVYHEKKKPERKREHLYRKTRKFMLYTLPQWREKVQSTIAQVSIPRQALLWGALILTAAVGAAAFGTVAVAAAAVGVAAHDPVLVIVTRDGRWVELDRWDD